MARTKKALTEASWEVSQEPARMLAALGEGVSERKLRMFGVACCWRSKDQDPASVERYRAAQEFAEGRLSKAQLRKAWNPTAANVPAYPEGPERWARAWVEGRDVCGLGVRVRAALLREIFGNPFRPASVDPAWLAWNGGVVAGLAQAAYEAEPLPEAFRPGGVLANDRLAVLADALEEAGCTDAHLLGHLRGPGPHIRGCWALDLARDVE
jgi:hypothetical protein